MMRLNKPRRLPETAAPCLSLDPQLARSIRLVQIPVVFLKVHKTSSQYTKGGKNPKTPYS